MRTLQQASLARLAETSSALDAEDPPLGSQQYGANVFKCALGIDNNPVPFTWLPLVDRHHLQTNIFLRGLCTQEVGTDERADHQLHLHLLTESFAPTGEKGCEMVKAHLKSFLKLPPGITRGLRFQVKTLDLVSQTMKCWASNFPQLWGIFSVAVDGIDHQHARNNRLMRELWFSFERWLVR